MLSWLWEEKSMPRNQAEQIWQRFQEIVDPQVLSAPRINWEKVPLKLLAYLCNQTTGTPWNNHYHSLWPGY
jgi:hypothetical protein